MISVLEWLYNCWPWITMMGVILGIISVLTGIHIFKIGEKTRSFVLLNSFSLGLVITFLCLAGIVNNSFVRVPYLRGKTVDEAISVLKDRNLDVLYPFGEKYGSETGGKIVRQQDYEDGKLVIKGTCILLLYDSASDSSPKETTIITVPNLVGEKYIDVVKKLADVGLLHRITSDNGKPATIDNLYVASQSIASGISVPKGSIIDLELTSTVDSITDTNKPNRMASVPNLINMDEKDAQELLLENGFMVTIQAPKALDDSLDHYYIISQSIEAGTEVPIGTHITLEKGAVKVGAQVTVPNLIGMEQSEATALLINQGLSFQVSVKASEANSSIYYVLNQSVSPNSQVTSGTIIRLELTSKKP